MSHGRLAGGPFQVLCVSTLSQILNIRVHGRRQEWLPRPSNHTPYYVLLPTPYIDSVLRQKGMTFVYNVLGINRLRTGGATSATVRLVIVTVI
jgi:hypothetical protein